MPSQFTPTWENNILNAVFRGQTVTFPAASSIAMALYSNTFSISSGTYTAATEISATGTGYARQAVTFNAPTQGSSLGSGNSITNSTQVTFPAATSTGGYSVNAYAICSSTTTGSTGTEIIFQNLTSAVSVPQNVSLQFNAGSITVTLV